MWKNSSTSFIVGVFLLSGLCITYGFLSTIFLVIPCRFIFGYLHVNTLLFYPHGFSGFQHLLNVLFTWIIDDVFHVFQVVFHRGVPLEPVYFLISVHYGGVISSAERLAYVGV